MEQDHLPVPSRVVVQLIRAASDPNFGVADISRMLASDPTLTTEVLRAVNSAFFGLGRRVTSVDYAVAFMGIRAIRNLVLCFGLRQVAPTGDVAGFPLERFWECSVRRGAAAFCLARRLGLPHAEELFTIGLLQDAGVAVFAGRGPDWAHAAAEAMNLPHRARLTAEESLGERHDDLGARLFLAWQLPPELTETIRFHHRPSDAPDEIRRRCEVASAAEAVADVTQVANKATALAYAGDQLEHLGLTRAELAEVVDEVARRVAEAAAMLQLHVSDQPSYREVIAMASQALLSLSLTYEDQVRGLEQAFSAQQSLAAELEAKNRELQELARTDALTGLPNRRTLESALARELAQARRQGSPLTVLMLDVDHFKRFNDTWGHRAGDRVLRELGAVLEGLIRKADLCARFGGEEFTVVLPFTDGPGGHVVAERIRDRVERMAVAWADEPLRVTVSVGGATDDGSSAPEDLLERADAALYRAKDAGRNRVNWHQAPRAPQEAAA